MRPVSLKFILAFLILPLLASHAEQAPSSPISLARASGYRLLEPDRAWARRTLRGLSLREKVAQMVSVRAAGKFLNRKSEDFRRLVTEVRNNRVGGVTLFSGNVYESAILLNDLQKLAPSPLLVSADFERGASFRIADTTSFPWTMAIGATGSEQHAFQEGAITAREARALGVHWIYAPVLDVNNNPDNPVINIRSFGEDPALVARLGAAFIRGARENGVLTTAKHFPGHGDTSTDSHIGLALTTSDRPRMDSVELVPFRKAIEAGVDSIMTAHIAAPKLTGDAGLPATLSPAILTDLLRKDLGFQGLIVTDALEMGGITSRFGIGQAAVRAVRAGADMLLLPLDTRIAVEEVLRAVKRGEIDAARIDRSVEKVLLLKTRLGLQRQRLVPLDRIADIVALPESLDLAQSIADQSVTVLTDRNHILPINPLSGRKVFSLVISADTDSAPASLFQAELRRRIPEAQTAAMDPRTPEAQAARILKDALESDIIVCSALIRVVSGRGNVALPESQHLLIERLMASGKPMLLVAFGNPYLLRLFPEIPAYMCTFSYADVSQIAAAKAISGEIPIGGKMPVSIPGLSSVGEGLHIPALDLSLRRAPAEELILSHPALDEVNRLLADYVQKKAFPGAALVVGYRGTIVLEACAGRLEYSQKSSLVSAETMYDLASLSKAIGTTSAAMVLVESGKLLLDAAVQDYLPEFQGTNKDKVTVHHLLTHSSGLPAFLALYKEAKGKDAVLEKVFAAPIDFEPGSRSRYSDLGMILLGEILERASGRPLNELVTQSLLFPLRLKATMYRPPRNLWPAIAPTEKDPWRGRMVRGEVHDENAYAMGGVAGHAGLFSTAHDLSIFAQMMLNRGLYAHRRVIQPDTIRRFVTPAGIPGNRALGWGKPDPNSWTGKTFSSSAFGHSGFTGTMIWIDPERQLFIVLLSNRVHPSRETTLVEEAKRTLSEAVMVALHAGTASQPGQSAAEVRR